MTNQLTPEDRLALSLVHRMMDSRRWGAKSRIFEEIAERQMREPNGVQVSYRTLSEALGIEPRWTLHLLTAMVADGVLELVERGRGKRPSSYLINPNVDTWKNAPLTVPVEAAMWRLRSAGLGQARHLVRLFPELGLEGPSVRQRSSLPNYFLRSQDPSLADLLAAGQRVTSDRTTPGIEQVWEAINALAALVTEGQRGTAPAVVPESGAAQDSALAAVAPLLSGKLRSPLKDGGGGVFDGDLSALLKAIYSRTGQPVGPPLRRRLEALVQQGCATVEELETWCRQAPPSFGPPLIVGLLEEMATTGGPEAVVTPRRSRDLLVRLIATYETEAPELVPELQEELAELDAAEGT